VLDHVCGKETLQTETAADLTENPIKADEKLVVVPPLRIREGLFYQAAMDIPDQSTLKMRKYVELKEGNR